jgi:hypothetical protein
MNTSPTNSRENLWETNVSPLWFDPKQRSVKMCVEMLPKTKFFQIGIAKVFCSRPPKVPDIGYEIDRG